MNTKFIRFSVAGALAAVLACAGCAPAVEVKTAPEDKSIQCVNEGGEVGKIKVSGEHGKDVKLEGGTPVSVEKQQTKVLEKGKGKQLQDGSLVRVAVSLFNGSDGKFIAKERTAVSLDKEKTPAWIGQAVACGTTDSRVVSVLKASNAFAKGATLPKGLKAEDTMIMVFDMLGTEPAALAPDKLLKKAEGEQKPAPAGFPTVKLDANGKPEITMPADKAPEKLSIATLIEGKGETVKPGDRVYVHYRGVIWSTGKEFDSSWKRGEPAAFTTDGVIRGFKEALEGKKVGSQIIAVVPANDGGYGPEQLQAMGHKPDDVMVFVLDILGTVHAE